MNDDELRFGEVQSKPRVPVEELSPDDDGHYQIGTVDNDFAVRSHPNQTADGHHTRVLVDLDTMLDMQEHAAEDTSVELGGVLLGYRGIKADGTPYVVVRDSLRARHYHATRGSFKFTHQTWADLNEQRAGLPESTEIVGWYHTHPGWSVFLSDLDVFICDHFFAHPDDVALVIDPTSGDTGLFVRRNTPANRPPGRLRRYQIYAHRKRAEIVDHWVAYFSGVTTMSNPSAVFPGRSAGPIVVQTPSDGSSNRLLVLLAVGLIGIQLMLGLFLFTSQRQNPPPAAADGPNDLAVRERVVDELIDRLSIAGPSGIDQSFRETVLQNAELKSANLGLLSRIETLSGELTIAADRSQRAMLEVESLSRELVLTRDQLAAIENTTEDDVGTGLFWRPEWLSLGAGTMLGVLIASIAVLLIRRPWLDDASKSTTETLS